MESRYESLESEDWNIGPSRETTQRIQEVVTINCTNILQRFALSRWAENWAWILARESWHGIIKEKREEKPKKEENGTVSKQHVSLKVSERKLGDSRYPEMGERYETETMVVVVVMMVMEQG